MSDERNIPTMGHGWDDALKRGIIIQNMHKYVTFFEKTIVTKMTQGEIVVKGLACTIAKK